MNHKFKRVEIPDGQTKIEETCVHCGIKCIRYTSGARSYFKENGSVTPYCPVSCAKGGATPEVKIVSNKKENNAIKVNGRVLIPLADWNKKHLTEPITPNIANGSKPLNEKPQHTLVSEENKPAFIPFTELESQLHDAYVILNVVYREMVSANMHTSGRDMLGRLLYSAGYKNTIQFLDKKQIV